LNKFSQSSYKVGDDLIHDPVDDFAESKNGWRVKVILATALSSVVVLMIVILGLAFTLRRNRKFILALQRSKFINHATLV
jgi:anti-sigma-K factor RskA